MKNQNIFAFSKCQTKHFEFSKCFKLFSGKVTQQILPEMANIFGSLKFHFLGEQKSNDFKVRVAANSRTSQAQVGLPVSLAQSSVVIAEQRGLGCGRS